MSIIWKYLDKRSAAVDALKDYGSMKFIIGHTDDEIKSAYEKMEGVSSPQLDGIVCFTDDVGTVLPLFFSKDSKSFSFIGTLLMLIGWQIISQFEISKVGTE